MTQKNPKQNAITLGNVTHANWEKLRLPYCRLEEDQPTCAWKKISYYLSQYTYKMASIIGLL